MNKFKPIHHNESDEIRMQKWNFQPRKVKAAEVIISRLDKDTWSVQVNDYQVAHNSGMHLFSSCKKAEDYAKARRAIYLAQERARRGGK